MFLYLEVKMARTAVLSKEQILESSFKLVNRVGLEKITVRLIAKELGTSTAPIYTQYKKMDEIKEDLTRYVDNQLMTHLQGDYTDDSFLNIGAGLLTFAYNNPKIFQTYYLTKGSLPSYMSKNYSMFIEYMKKNSFLALLEDKRLESLIDDMWVYTFGLATIIATSDKTDDLKEYIKKIESTGEKLIKYHLFSSGNIEKCFYILSENVHKCSNSK